MTDRLHALTVVLEQDTRDDDAEALIAAIQQMRGVASVRGRVADPKSYAALERARFEVRDQIAAVLWPKVTR